MSRRVGAALVLWAAIVATWILLQGGDVFMCLGPLGVTEESCRAANGLPPLTEWDRVARGWAPRALVFMVGAAAIMAVARWKRQRGGL